MNDEWPWPGLNGLKECLPTVGALGDIDVEICSRCGGAVKVIADTSDRCIEDQSVIDKILSHLKKKDGLNPLMYYVKPERRLTNSRRHEANQLAWLTLE
jgi:predicted amidophosphoribosyltransferase